MNALLLPLATYAVFAVPPEQPVTVQVAPTDSAVVLGDSLHLHVTVTNDGTRPTGTLVVHLDVTDPGRSTSVDPEDWTSTLTRPAGVLAPGASTTLDWTVQPISPGRFTVYAVALPADHAQVPASNGATVTVEDHRVLDPGGILPVVLGVPLAVGAWLVLRLRAARRPYRRRPLQAPTPSDRP